MIAEHHEPKLLAPDAPPVWDLKRVLSDKEKAAKGSARLRDAIRHSLGVDPWPRPKPRDNEKRRSSGRDTPSFKLWRKRVSQRAKVLDVQKVACRHFGISICDLVSPSRAHPLTRQRQVAMLVSRIATQASYPDIGACFNRDHTTVIYACEVVRSTDPDVIAICEKLAR